MYRIVFVTHQNHVVFHTADEATAIKTISDFEGYLSRVTKEADQAFWGLNENGEKVMMVRCSWVVGLYIVKPEESWKQ